MSDSQSPVVASPEAGAKSRTSPIVAIAAISVIIFSAVGVGVMTGVIPSTLSKSGEHQAANDPPAQPAVETRSAQAPAPAQSAPQQRPAKTAARKSTPKTEATKEPVRVASAPPATPAICANCGSVTAVNVVEQQGEGSGLGAVAGGVAGALLGNQIGGGSGRKIATVAGAAGGAYAGHQIEKHVKTTKRYDVVVRMQDGSSRTFPYEKEPGFHVGDKVKVVEGTLVAN
jgi:outer membrane lipoprotein SlyB